MSCRVAKAALGHPPSPTEPAKTARPDSNNVIAAIGAKVTRARKSKPATKLLVESDYWRGAFAAPCPVILLLLQ